MAISHNDLLAIGDRLARGRAEVEWRLSCSCAYFAAFHGCKGALPVLPISVPRVRGSHNKIIKAYKDCSSTNLTDEQLLNARVIGLLLEQLRSLRARSDYSLEATVSQQDSARALHTANDLLAIVGELLQEAQSNPNP